MFELCKLQTKFLTFWINPEVLSAVCSFLFYNIVCWLKSQNYFLFNRLFFVFQQSTSWISEEDFYKPEMSRNSEGHVCVDTTQMNGQVKTTPEPDDVHSPPSVVHRRQNGKMEYRCKQVLYFFCMNSLKVFFFAFLFLINKHVSPWT